MANQLTLVATLRAKAGHEDELGRRLQALVEPTRGEPGCLNYDLHRSNDDAAAWMLYENWRAREDLDAHFEMPYLRALLKDLPDLLAEEMDLRYFTMASNFAA